MGMVGQVCCIVKADIPPTGRVVIQHGHTIFRADARRAAEHAVLGPARLIGRHHEHQRHILFSAKCDKLVKIFLSLGIDGRFLRFPFQYGHGEFLHRL